TTTSRCPRTSSTGTTPDEGATVRIGHTFHTSTQRYVEDDPHVGRAGKGQRNGVPQKKQNRLFAFTIVPQFGQRFLIAVAVGMGMEGICWVGAGRTNSLGGGGPSTLGCASVAVGGGCDACGLWAEEFGGENGLGGNPAGRA